MTKSKAIKSKIIQKSEAQKPQKAKSALDDIDPFSEFKEWTSDADNKAYDKL